MSSIDERIVAMRFDNGQFEKGVKQSMRTLQELREATNLDDVAASMGDVSKSINQNLQFQSPTKSAGIFSKALTSLGKVAKTTFNATTFPLQALGRSLQSLGKYTRAVLGIDIASRLVHTGEQVIRAFTIDPLKSGWNEYELKMDSIKTIMTGTVKTYTDAMTKKDPQFLYDEEKHLDYVKQGLEELNKYADDTVYSFQDMTNNIGKFTNAGVDFDTAVDAIKGVANAAAHAGQGAAQASSAMYNISQSLGMGYLGMMDWRSIENANMATLTFKQTLIDMGVALGQLKKDEKSGKLYTINEKGVVDNSMEVTAENLRETLSKKWVNKEVLLNALRVYSGEFSEEELRGLKNLTDKEKAQLRKIGEEAALAATQVRTFTKMWDALKEAAQSGWGISWELIFGDLNEATEFWTNLNNRFSALLENQAKSREAILRAWRGQKKLWNFETGEWEWMNAEGMEDGRKILVDALNEMLDTIGEVGRGIGEAWTSIFGTITGQNLLDVTKKLKTFTKTFSNWIGKRNDPTSRIGKLTTGLKGIFSVLKGAGSTIKGAITTISQTLRLDKLLDAGISAFGKAGEWLGSLGESISGIWESIGQTEIMQKLSGFFEGLWESVSKFFTEKNPDTNQTGFMDWLTGAITTLNNTWNRIKSNSFVQGVEQFFTDLWNSVSKFFTEKNPDTNQTGFMDWLTGAITALNNTWNEIKGNSFVKDVEKFFTDLWNSVSNFFTEKNPDTNQTGFMNFVTNALTSIRSTWDRIGNSAFVTGISRFFTDLWNSVSKFFTEKNPNTNQTGFMDWLTGAITTLNETWNEIKGNSFVKGVEKFFTDLWNSVSNFFTEKNPDTNQTGFMDFVTNALTSIRETWDEIGNSAFVTGISDFFTNLWKSVKNFVSTATAIPEGGSWQDSPIGKVITSVGSWLQQGWTWIEKKVGPIAKQIGGFLNNTFDWIMGKAENSGNSKSRLEIPKNALKVAHAISAMDFEFDPVSIPKEAQQNNFLSFFTNLFGTISDFVGKVKDWQGWSDIGNVFSIVFTGIKDSIKAFAEITGLTSIGEVAKALTSLLEVIAKIIAVISKIAVAAADAINGKATSEQITTLVETIMGIIAAISAKLIAKDLFGTSAETSKVGLLKVLAKLTAIIGWVTAISLVMWGLEEALEGIFGKETVEKIPEKIHSFAQIFVSIANSVGEVIGSIVGGFKAGDLKGTTKGMSEALKNVEDLTDEDMERLEKLMSVFKSISAGLPSSPNTLLAWFGRDMTLGEFSVNIRQLGEGLAAFSESFKEVSIDDQLFNKIPEWTRVLTALSKELPPDPGVLGKWFSHEMTLGEFGTNMAQLGSGLKSFSDNAAGITDFSYVTSAIDSISSLVKAAATIALLDDIGGGNWNAANYVYQMTSLIGGLNNVLSRYTDNAFSEEFEPLITFGEMFDADIKAAADSITIEPIIQSVLDQLSSGKARISEGFGAMFPSSVRPVYDVNNEADMPLLSYQNGSVTLSGTVQIDTASLYGVVEAINSQGNRISSAIAGLGSKMDSVASAVRSMKIVLNTGVVAGAVDNYLGNQATVNGRTGTGRNTHGPVMNGTQLYNNYVR